MHRERNFSRYVKARLKQQAFLASETTMTLREKTASHHSCTCTLCAESLLQGHPGMLYPVQGLTSASKCADPSTTLYDPSKVGPCTKLNAVSGLIGGKPKERGMARPKLAVHASVKPWSPKLLKAELPSLGRKRLQILRCSTVLSYQYTTAAMHLFTT